MNRGLAIILVFSILLLFTGGCAPREKAEFISPYLQLAEQGGYAEPPEEQPAITSLTIEDYSLSVEVSRPFTYTIYRSGDDPFKVIAELYNVLPGILQPPERIVSHKEGIREILPMMDPKGLRLEISLQAPLKEEVELKDNLLIVRFIEEFQPEPVTPPVAEVEILPVEPKAEIPEAVVVEKAEEPLLRLPQARTVKEIRLSKKDRVVEVEILADGEMRPNVFPLDRKIVIDIPDTTVTAKIPQPIAPLKDIRIGRHPDKTRIVLDLMEKTPYEVNARGDRLLLSVMVPEPRRVEVAEKKEERRVIERPEVAVALPPVEEPVKYKGRRISLDFQDADLTAILRLIGDVSGYNVVIHPDVKGRITLKLLNVPWDQALDIILKTYGLDAAIEGNVIRIAPHAVLAKEYEEKAKAVEAGLKAEPLITRVYSVNFADPKDVEKFLKDSKVLSPRGNISIDARTRSVIIKDVEAVFPEIERLLKSLDRPTPQVLIDARIVEVNSSFVREMGIQWGINWLSPNTLLRIGGPPGMPGGAGFTGTNFMVNLPAPVGPGSGGAIGLGYMNAQRTLGLDLQLSALEATGKGKVISNPRIVTLDNKEALIRQGKQIPVQTVSAEGTQTTVLNAVLELKVTPSITPDGSIQLKLDTKKDEPDFTRLVGGIPTIDTQQATTDVLIRDGETLVIGGIFKKAEHVSEGGVPLLSRIPILGWLFKKERTSEDTSELMVFITPRIIK